MHVATKGVPQSSEPPFLTVDELRIPNGFAATRLVGGQELGYVVREEAVVALVSDSCRACREGDGFSGTTEPALLHHALPGSRELERFCRVGPAGRIGHLL